MGLEIGIWDSGIWMRGERRYFIFKLAHFQIFKSKFPHCYICRSFKASCNTKNSERQAITW
jgi:hypothetical protein